MAIPAAYVYYGIMSSNCVATERYALELCWNLTCTDVAQHLQVSWDLIKEIQMRYLHKRLGPHFVPCGGFLVMR